MCETDGNRGDEDDGTSVTTGAAFDALVEV